MARSTVARWLISCVFYLYFTCKTTTCSDNQTDILALLSFKNSLIDPRGALDSWKSNETVHFCSWKGISCGTKHQSRVVSINLDSQALEGSISPHLGNLSFLRSISLRNNSLHGPIPQELGRLRRLGYIEFSNNSFDGEIPGNLSRCQNLYYLNLIDNQLTGTIPHELGSLSELNALGLSDNDFSGTSIPPSLGNLTSLTKISLAKCGLLGEIPESFANLRKLQQLMLYENMLTGTIPPGLFNISTIMVFSVFTNQLQGTIPSDIGLTLSKLTNLGLGENGFTGTIPISLSNASSLQYIGLFSNGFTGPMPRNLDRLSDLRYLSIWSTNVEDDISFISSLANCTSLTVVDIYDNHLTGSLPPSIGNITSTHLRKLTLDKNYIHGTIPSEIGNLIGLSILSLHFNFFSGPIPSTIGKLTRLQEINLSANMLTNEIPSSLGNLTLLNNLFMTRNNLSGNLPTSLANLSHLLILDLSVNNLSGPITREIMSLSSISIYLDLSYNALSGRVPSEVGSLTNLGDLDLSNNRLSGNFPNMISSCISLQRLHLDDNLFDGEIPRDLSSLKGLRDLDLSRNNFSGTIPSFLEELTGLVNLNLSFNRLQGPVPMEGVFRNTSAVSLEGNNELCGGIPELKLPHCSPSRNSREKKKKKKKNSMVLIPSVVSGTILFVVVLACSYILLIYRRRANTRNKNKPHNSSFESQFKRLSYADLLKATGGFTEANVIGSGKFGSVYKGILEDGNTSVAVKVLNLQVGGAYKSFISECDALKIARHRNVLKILSISVGTDFRGNDFTALLYSFMSNGSLEDWLHENSSRPYLTLMQRLNIAIDVACGVEYLHDGTGSVIVHGDLKPSNVLLDDDMSAHVGDFGLARVISNISSGLVVCESSSIGVKGTIGYIAPEYGMDGAISTRGDVYSYGILLLELFTNIRPTSDHPLLTDRSNLHDIVTHRLPDRAMEIVDPLIVQSEGRHEGIIASLLGIGVACSQEASQDRLSMADVVIKLKRIRMKCQLAQGSN